MTEDERSIDHLEVMLENARQGMSLVEGMDLTEFLADGRTQLALAMVLVNIGEMASRVMRRNPGLVAQHPEMPWQQMTNMRNRIAHGYDRIDFNIVWDIARDSLPVLASEIPNVLRPLLETYDPPKPPRTPDA